MWNNANADLDMVQKGAFKKGELLTWQPHNVSVGYCKIASSTYLVPESTQALEAGLDDYLETKRGAFARFYFLSNVRGLDGPWWSLSIL